MNGIFVEDHFLNTYLVLVFCYCGSSYICLYEILAYACVRLFSASKTSSCLYYNRTVVCYLSKKRSLCETFRLECSSI